MSPTVTAKQIAFENTRIASAVLATSTTTPKEIIEALNLPAYSSVLLLIGGAGSLDETLKPRLSQLLGRGVARAAITVNALIVDGGTQAGVMKMMGEGVAARGYNNSLLGIVPGDLVKFPGSTGTGQTPLEPNHSHFVLVPGDKWGSETSTIFKLIAEFGADKQPVVTLVIGGGGVTKDEALQAVRQNIQLLVVEGSGGIADEIASAWKARPALPDDPVMAEIIADGQVERLLLSDENAVRSAERLVLRELGSDSVLMQAWNRFADYDSNASLQERRFNRMQTWIIRIGVAATTLAIFKEVFAPRDAARHFVTSWKGWWFVPYPFPTRNYYPWVGWWLLYYVLIAIPVLISVLVAAGNKFKQGNKWLLLRSGGETIKREIYRYRARAGEYSELVGQPPAATTPAVPTPTPDQVLAQRVEDASRRLMQTEVNSSTLISFNNPRQVPGDRTLSWLYRKTGLFFRQLLQKVWPKGFPPDKPKRFPPAISKLDDGWSVLTPDRYIQVRLNDQLDYYRRQAVRMEWTVKKFQWSIYIIGGIGTLLAAIDQQVWIALTTAFAAAFATYLSYTQTENTLIKFNQAATNLENVKSWWMALPPAEQAKQSSVDALVDHTEKVLQSEMDGWVQQMQNALAELRKGQAQTTEGGVIITPVKATTNEAVAKATITATGGVTRTATAKGAAETTRVDKNPKPPADDETKGTENDDSGETQDHPASEKADDGTSGAGD